jgi:hypothetical protein
MAMAGSSSGKSLEVDIMVQAQAVRSVVFGEREVIQSGNAKVAPVCQACHSPLMLSLGYTGCDWDTVAGDGSGHGHVVSLECTGCNRVYPLLGVRDVKEISVYKAAFRDHTL